MANPFDVYKVNPKSEKPVKKDLVKTVREVASNVLPSIFSPLPMFGPQLPTEGLPRATLPKYDNPILNFIFKDMAEDLINQPASSIESYGKLNKYQKQVIAGDKTDLQNPQQLIGETANAALLPLTFFGGGTVGTVGKSAVKSGLKSAIGAGIKSGIKAGASYGGAQGLASSRNADTIQEQLLEGTKGALTGGALGGVTGGITAPIAKVISKVLPSKSIQNEISARNLENSAPKQVENMAVDSSQLANTTQSLNRTTEANTSTLTTVLERIKSHADKQLETAQHKAKNLFLVDFRTPEHVLKKMGLHDSVYLPLKKGQEFTEKEIQQGYTLMNKWYKDLGGDGQSQVRVFDWLDGQPIALSPTEEKVGTEIRQYFKQWADKLDLPEDKRITNYITHLFENDLKENQIPDELTDLLDYTAKQGFFNPFLEERTGAVGYQKKLFVALDAYITRSSKKLHLDEPVKQTIGQMETLNQQAKTYVNRVIEGLKNRPDGFEKFMQRNLIDALPEKIRTKAGYRPVRSASQFATQTIYRGALGLNLNSALKNLTQGVNTYSELGEKYVLLGYKDLIRRGTKELVDVGVLDDMMRAEYKTTATQRNWGKVDKVLFWMFENAEKINRGSAYYAAKQKALDTGFPEQRAIEYAKQIVRKTQFAYGKLDTPLALQSSWGRPLFQFSTFPIKQAELVGGWMRNKQFAKLARYTASSLAITYAVGDILGIGPKDMLFKNIVPGFGPIPDLIGSGIKTVTAKLDGREPNYEDEYQLKSAPKLLLPAGVQADKTIQGVNAAVKEGVYTKKGKLKYAVETPEDKIRALLFGPWRTRGAIDEKKANEEAFSFPDLLNAIQQTNESSASTSNPYSKYRVE